MRFDLKTSLVSVAVLLLSSAATADQESRQALRIDGGAYLGDLPTIVADARGLFADQGLDVVIDYSKSGRRNLQRLRAGEVDFALMMLTPLVLDRLADSTPGEPDDPVILASLLQAHQLLSIVTAPGSGLEAPADFAGRRIAVEPETSSEFIWWLFEQFHGIERASVQLIPIAFTEMAAAIGSGRVDAAVMPEPWAAHLQEELNREQTATQRRFNVRDLHVGKWVLVTTRKQAHQRQDICRDLLTAYRNAIDFIEKEPDEALSHYEAKVKNSQNVDLGNWHSVNYDINLDWSLVAGLQQQLQWARSTGYGNAAAQVHVLEFIEPRPMHVAIPQAMHLPQAMTRNISP